MEQRTITVISAEPGWWVVGPVHSEDGIKELCEDPIIAWRIETVTRDDGGLIDRVTPVVADELPLEYILRRPDRSMFVPAFAFREGRDGPIASQAEALDWFRAARVLNEDLNNALQEAIRGR
jgi:hypothetical protein